MIRCYRTCTAYTLLSSTNWLVKGRPGYKRLHCPAIQPFIEPNLLPDIWAYCKPHPLIIMNDTLSSAFQPPAEDLERPKTYITSARPARDTIHGPVPNVLGKGILPNGPFELAHHRKQATRYAKRRGFLVRENTSLMEIFEEIKLALPELDRYNATCLVTS